MVDVSTTPAKIGPVGSPPPATGTRLVHQPGGYNDSPTGRRQHTADMEPYVYNAVVADVVTATTNTPAVHDGDSFHVNLDLGLGIWSNGLMVRFTGANAAEIGTPGGNAARDNLRTVLPVGTRLVLHSVAWDKFGGRIDAEVFLADGTDLIAQLIAEQWLAAWDGTGTRPVPPWPRTVA